MPVERRVIFTGLSMGMNCSRIERHCKSRTFCSPVDKLCSKSFVAVVVFVVVDNDDARRVPRVFSTPVSPRGVSWTLK